MSQGAAVNGNTGAHTAQPGTAAAETTDQPVTTQPASGAVAVNQAVVPATTTAATSTSRAIPTQYQLKTTLGKLELNQQTLATVVEDWKASHFVSSVKVEIVVEGICKQLEHGNIRIVADMIAAFKFSPEEETKYLDSTKQDQIAQSFKKFTTKFGSSLRIEADLEGLARYFKVAGLSSDKQEELCDSIFLSLVEGGFAEHALGLLQRFSVTKEAKENPTIYEKLSAEKVFFPKLDSRLDPYSQQELIRVRAETLKALYGALEVSREEVGTYALAALQEHVRTEGRYAALVAHVFELDRNVLDEGGIGETAKTALSAAIASGKLRDAIGIANLFETLSEETVDKAATLLSGRLAQSLARFDGGADLKSCIDAFGLRPVFLTSATFRNAFISGVQRDLLGPQDLSPTEIERYVRDFDSVAHISPSYLNQLVCTAASTCVRDGYISRAVQLLDAFNVSDETLAESTFGEAAATRLLAELEKGEGTRCKALIELVKRSGLVIEDLSLQAQAARGFGLLLREQPDADTTWVEALIPDRANLSSAIADTICAGVQKKEFEATFTLLERFPDVRDETLKIRVARAFAENSYASNFNEHLGKLRTIFSLSEADEKLVCLNRAEHLFSEKSVTAAWAVVKNREIEAEAGSSRTFRLAAAKALGAIVGANGVTPQMVEVIEGIQLQPEELAGEAESAELAKAVLQLLKDKKFDEVETLRALFSFSDEQFDVVVAEGYLHRIENGHVRVAAEILERWPISDELIRRTFAVALVERCSKTTFNPQELSRLSNVLKDLSGPPLDDPVYVQALQGALIDELKKSTYLSTVLPRMETFLSIKGHAVFNDLELRAVGLTSWFENLDKPTMVQTLNEHFGFSDSEQREHVQSQFKALLEAGDGVKLKKLMQNAPHPLDWLRDEARAPELSEGVYRLIVKDQLECAVELCWRADFSFLQSQEIAYTALPTLVADKRDHLFNKVVKHFSLAPATELESIHGPNRELFVLLESKHGIKTLEQLIAALDATQSPIRANITDYKSSVSPTKPATVPAVSVASDSGVGKYDEALDSLLCDPRTVVSVYPMPLYQQQTGYTCATATFRMVAEGVTAERYSERAVMQMIDTTEAIGTPISNFELARNRLQDLEIRVQQNGSFDELRELLAEGWAVGLNYSNGSFPHYSALAALGTTHMVLFDPTGPARKVVPLKDFKWEGGYGEAVVKGGYFAMRRR